MSQFVIVGYGGHAYIVCDILKANNKKIHGYFEQSEKEKNPFNLKYLGKETQKGSSDLFLQNEWFVAFDNNHFRKFITQKLLHRNIGMPASIFHPSCQIGEGVPIGTGSLIGSGTIINILSNIGDSAIINTHATIGYECQLSDYVHIATGAVLANNVSIGERSFVGANAVIKEGIKIGNEVRIGAGSVIIQDVEDGSTIVGNPGRVISLK